MINHIKIVVLGVLMFFSTHISAQTVAQNVLDEVVISSSGYTGIIKVIFRIPVRYISHNPLEVGNEIRIKVDFLNSNLKRGLGNLREDNSNRNNQPNDNFNNQPNNRFNNNANREVDSRSIELSLREAIVPPKRKDSFGLEEVSYERVLSDDYVTLYFSKNVSFEIIQDSNYRSLSIIIHDKK